MPAKKQFDIEVEESAGRRRAYRVPNPELSVTVQGQPEAKVLDLSPLGIGLSGLRGVESGTELEVRLNGDSSVSDPFVVQVVRADGESVGCEIRNVDRFQSYALHSMVLRFQQKRIVNMRRIEEKYGLD